jgi:hypothetical protein
MHLEVEYTQPGLTFFTNVVYYNSVLSSILNSSRRALMKNTVLTFVFFLLGSFLPANAGSDHRTIRSKLDRWTSLTNLQNSSFLERQRNLPAVFHLDTDFLDGDDQTPNPPVSKVRISSLRINAVERVMVTATLDPLLVPANKKSGKAIQAFKKAAGLYARYNIVRGESSYWERHIFPPESCHGGAPVGCPPGGHSYPHFP